MIIFGSKGVESNMGSGVFFCPNCGGDQRYWHKHVRRYFTLYFIPLIPLDKIGEIVQCTGCGQTWDPEVLTFDPQAAISAFNEDLKRVMILMALADGPVDADEIAAMKAFFQRVTEQALGDAEIQQEVRLAQGAGTDVSQYAASRAADWADAGLVLIIQAAFAVASAGGALHPAKQGQLQQLKTTLNVSDEDFKVIIQHFTENE